jgi:hypothetical protein
MISPNPQRRHYYTFEERRDQIPAEQYAQESRKVIEQFRKAKSLVRTGEKVTDMAQSAGLPVTM